MQKIFRIFNRILFISILPANPCAVIPNSVLYLYSSNCPGFPGFSNEWMEAVTAKRLPICSSFGIAVFSFAYNFIFCTKMNSPLLRHERQAYIHYLFYKFFKFAKKMNRLPLIRNRFLCIYPRITKNPQNHAYQYHTKWSSPHPIPPFLFHVLFLIYRFHKI